MTGEIQIRLAVREDADAVADILHEAAEWLHQEGMPLWVDGELDTEDVDDDVRAGLFLLAEKSGDAIGVVKFQLDDPVFWPDMRGKDAAYVHRLAVRRSFAGAGLSTALLNSAVERTRHLDRRYLRLDCPASRPRLRAVYERFGFRFHSERQVGPYFVSRYQLDVSDPGTAAPSR
jgi:GNAT superfamily N-acetyltransferase